MGSAPAGSASAGSTHTAQPGADLALLRLLQLGDSGFPSGAYTLSHGLETLVADGLVRGGDALPSLIKVHLLARFARSDLVSLLAAHDAARDATHGATRAAARAAGSDAARDAARDAAPAAPAADDAAHLVDADRRITSIDRRLTASKLAADERLGSERVGRWLAVEVSRLVPADRIVAFLAAIEAGTAPGNAAVAFGLAGQALGIDRRRTALAAASAQVMGLVAAAVRLGLIGHAAGQHCIAGAAPVIVAAVELASSRDWRELRPSAPQLDIALARHERAPARSFVS